MDNKYRKNAIAITRKKLSFKRSERTISCYLACLKDVFKAYPETMPSKITDAQFESFLYKRLTEGISDSHQNQYINAIKAYRIEVLNRNDAKKFKKLRPKKKKHLPRPISEEQIKSGFSQIKNVKHKAMCMLLYCCGLRMEELLSLRINHFDKGVLRINGKGDKDRIVTYDHVLKKTLIEYCTKYKIEDHLFYKYSPSSVRKVVRSFFHCKPHQLRHSFATHLHNHGVSILDIQKMLGHSSPQTTQIYAEVSDAHLRDVYKPESLLV